MLGWVLVIAACSGPTPIRCDDVVEGAEALPLAAPADGSVLSSPWAPVRVDLPWEHDRAVITMCLDGEDVTDPLGIERYRSGQHGPRGWDYLAWLDLVPLEDGPHRLEVFFSRSGGAVSLAESELELVRPGHRVEVQVVDGAGEAVPCRIVVLGAGGAPVDLGIPSADAWDLKGRDVPLHSAFAPWGTATLDLPDGDYRLVATRSILDHVAVAELHLEEDVELELVLDRAVPLPDHLMADLHVHTGRSYDSFLPDRVRWYSLMGAGLDAVALTDHNEVTDPGPSLAVLLDDGPVAVHGVAGVEADVEEDHGDDHSWDLAHLNAFPVVGQDEARLPTQKPPSLAWLLDAYRERQADHPHPHAGEEVVLQLNHPRGIHFWPGEDPLTGAWPYFSQMDYDPTVPLDDPANAWATEEEPRTGTTALDFDALEVVNRFSWPLYTTVRRDWYALVSQGATMTGTGNSDSHALQVESAGFPVNLVEVPAPGPGGELDVPALIAAVREGRVLVSTGPVVTLDARQGDGTWVAEVRVRAAPWVPVSEVRLVVDGEVAESREVPAREEGEVLDLTWIFEGALERDLWLVGEAGWPLEDEPVTQPEVGGLYGVVAPGYVPLGFTNPVRLDADGDGWDPPGI